MPNETNTWGEYSMLVISELERLNDGITKLNSEIQDLKSTIIELKAREDNVTQLKKWKDSIDEVTSPSQLKETIAIVNDLKLFRTQSITVWAVVQVLFTIAMIILNYFK